MAEEVAGLFPEARLKVLSSDLFGSARALREEIQKIAAGEADIIIGTQIVAWLGTGVIFTIGAVGVLTRRNVIIIFMAIELMLNAVNINLVAHARYLENLSGQVFVVFVIAVAAAEAAVGLGILLAFFRNKETVNIDEMNIMRW